ncbi:MAG TPA: nitrite/sulfite reductase [Gammaproteobacteria bacterium]|nr:nitrite/sulfite reductase [Gammaproteobacteria bacterium]
MNKTQTLVNRDELVRYRESVQAFLENRIDAERFQSMRLQQGVYGQRQEGVNMVRVKIPGGRCTAAQLARIGDVLEKYSRHDKAHITTRQDIQIHHVPLEHTPAALDELAEAGLTTREACNNTVRNVTACPLAGVCPREHVDITTYADRAVRHFLRHPLTQHLPRKFKISFSACERDCAQGMMHDLGVVATTREGRNGFKILAGGGLGHKPHHAITVEEFIEEGELLASMEALIALHNRYSDRKKRAKSRIKFLVDRFGPEGFVEKYREELERTRAALADVEPVAARWNTPKEVPGCDNPGAPRRPLPQKQAGLYAFPISVPIGDLTASQLRGIAKIMDQQGLEEARTTQDQNLLLVNVPEERLDAVRTALKALGLAEPVSGDNVVACPGTSTCRLGITASKAIGAKLHGGVHDLRIRASGCHNGCAQPETGDIGIYGEGRRRHGKLIPHYQMYIGGDGREGGGLAIKGPSIPAARIEAAIARLQDSYDRERLDGESFFQWSHRHEAAYFKELLADLAEVAPEDVPSVLYDHGDEDAFKVVQFGGGECAGAAQETVAANFAEAANERNYRNAFLLQRKYAESLECAREVARLVGQSLLFLAGQEADDDLKTIAARLSEALTNEPALGESLARFADTLDRLAQDFDDAVYAELNRAMDQWTNRAAAVCQDIDQQLDLSASLPEVAGTGDEEKKKAEVIDLTAYGCPLHYIKARNALRNYPEGQVIQFLFSAEEPAEQASSSLKSDGHEILAIEEDGDAVRVSVRKAG